MSRPSHNIRPSRGVSKPATAFTSVDLPAPDGPITAMIPPGSTLKSARNVNVPLPSKTESRRSMSSPPVTQPERRQGQRQQQKRRTRRGLHPVGPHQAIHLQRQRRAFGIGEQDDHAKIA